MDAGTGSRVFAICCVCFPTSVTSPDVLIPLEYGQTMETTPPISRLLVEDCDGAANRRRLIASLFPVVCRQTVLA